MKAIVVGGGIGGMATAAALHQQGIEAVVLERTHQLTEIGAGMQIGANAMWVLEDLGLADRLRTVACEAQHLSFRDLLTDEVLFTMPLGETAARRYHQPFFQVHRADLLTILAGAVPAEWVHHGARVVDIIQDRRRAGVRLADGSTVEGDVVIGSDGIRSSVRSWMFGAEQPRFSGTLSWRALLPREAVADLDFGVDCDSWLAPGRSVVTYWLRRGQAFNVAAFVRTREVRRESWTQLGCTDELRAEMAGACPRIDGLMRRVDKAFLTGVYYHEPTPGWSTGRVTLLGDAAHATQPYLAQGACQSLEDAAVVARLLADHGPDDVPGALAEFEQRRRPRTTKVQAFASGAERFWHETDPRRIAARNGRFRGLLRIDPLAETVWAWMFDHDPIAALESPASEARGLARSHDAAHLDRPEARRAAELWRTAFRPTDFAGGWVGLRAAYERFTTTNFPPPDDAVVDVLRDGPVRGRWVAPRRYFDAPVPGEPVVLHVHGGGFMFGSADGATELAYRLARAAGGRVFALDYRLAPEHPFPAALDDVLAAYRWLLDTGTPAERIVVTGESAGGGLALCATAALAGERLPPPAGVYVMSPITDLAVTGASVDATAGLDPTLDRDTLTDMSASYLQGADPADGRASAIHADFTGAPPLLVHAGANEALLDDAVRVVAAAEAAGVDAQLRTWPDTVHVFPMIASLPETREALDDFGCFVRRVTHR